MSSGRSRSGGRWMTTVFRRYRRSSRKRPAAISTGSSALVADSTRTFTNRSLDEPTRCSSPVCSTRSSLAWSRTGMLAISSRNSVPSSASSKQPMRSNRASVNAPLTCPKSSLSAIPSARPPAFIVTSGRLRRSESACSQVATTSLPVPCSPVISTAASDGAIRSMVCRTSRIAAESPMNTGVAPRCSRAFASCSRWPFRSARRRSIWVLTVTSSRSSSHGFSM